MSAIKSIMEDIYTDFMNGLTPEEICERNECTTDDLALTIITLSGLEQP